MEEFDDKNESKNMLRTKTTNRMLQGNIIGEHYRGILQGNTVGEYFPRGILQGNIIGEYYRKLLIY